MIIKKLKLILEPTEQQSLEGQTSKAIEMTDNEWSLPSSVWPAEIKLISALQAMIDEFNRKNK